MPIRAGKKRGYEFEMHKVKIFWIVMAIMFLATWGVNLVLSMVWYGGVRGCSHPATRHHLGHFCLVQFEKRPAEVPWYLDLWDTHQDQHNYSNITISSGIESIMTSPLQVQDIELALRRQIAKLKDADNTVPNATLQDLGEL